MSGPTCYCYLGHFLLHNIDVSVSTGSYVKCTVVTTVNTPFTLGPYLHTYINHEQAFASI